MPAIPFKIATVQERKLKRAKNYWKNILEIKQMKDVYSESLIDKDANISIDHFIPWSFVLHDKLWNLVPTFQSTNSSKSDKLPKLDQYLDKFCEIQLEGFKLALKYDLSAKYLEDYLETNKNLRLSKKVPGDMFKSSLKETITPIYQIAKNQGFMLWKPTN